jgi:hypothetical protein
MLDHACHVGLGMGYDVSEQHGTSIPLLAGSKADMTNPLREKK